MSQSKITPHKIYALIGQKGGAGKSTTAGHLAYWLHQLCSVMFIDADGQQSASPWMQDLGISTLQINNPEQLFEELPTLARQYDAIVVDGPGNAGEITKSILGRCDIAIVPNRPAEFDLRSSATIVQFVRHVRELRSGMPKALLFLNASKGKRSVLLREAQDALANCPIKLSKTVISDLTCITDAPGQRKTVFRMSGEQAAAAADAYDKLFDEVLKELHD
jgi:chromosome partitioning protein